MLIAGGSFVAGSDNPHHGTSMPLGPSTPSVLWLLSEERAPPKVIHIRATVRYGLR
jgi:hypothetical protein